MKKWSFLWFLAHGEDADDDDGFMYGDMIADDDDDYDDDESTVEGMNSYYLLYFVKI